MTRDEIQEKAVNLISKNDRLLLAWATGVGKSYSFIRIQGFLQAKKTYIVVAEVAHIKNWENEYKKHGREDLLKNTKIFCYASLKNNLDENVDLLCLDEGHHATSEIRLDHLTTIKATKIVALTATIGLSKKLALESIYGEFKVDTIPLKQAIAWGIIPEPSIYLIPLELNKVDYNCTIVQGIGKSELRVNIHCKIEDKWTYLKNKAKYPNINLIMSCTETQKSQHYDEQSKYWRSAYMRNRQEYQKVKWLLTGSERKRFLANCKTEKVKPFLRYLKEKRFICFCGSIEQANILGKGNAIHSKMMEGSAAASIEDFSSGKINNLFVVGMLQEGQNLPNIEAGVIIQLDGEERPFIQKSGRVFRAKDPILFVFYYKNTRDEEYLAKILEGINPEYIQVVNSIEELI